jgi:hypothetical protein
MLGFCLMQARASSIIFFEFCHIIFALRADENGSSSARDMLLSISPVITMSERLA